MSALRRRAQTPVRARQLSLRRLNRDPLDALRRLQERQGDVAEFRLGRQRGIYLSDGELAWRLCTRHADDLAKWGTARRWWWRRPDSTMRGELLETHDRDAHLHARRALQPCFRLRAAAEDSALMADAAERTLAAAAVQGAPVDLYQLSDIVVLAMSTASLCDFRLTLPEMQRLSELVARTPSRWTDRFSSGGRAWSSALRRPRRTLEAGRATLRVMDTVAGHVARHRSERLDLLPELVASAGARDVPAATASVLLGLVGPAAAPMLRVLLEATREPLASQLRAEAQRAFADDGDGRATLFDRLPLARRVALEALRLGPGWQVSRTCKRSFSFEGIEVRQGDWLLVSPYLLHRDARHWPEPEAFDPDRWLEEAQAGRPRGVYAPFGYGARKCLAADLVDVQLTLAAAVAAAGWRIDPSIAIDDLGWVATGTGSVEPATAVKAQLEPLDSQRRTADRRVRWSP